MKLFIRYDNNNTKTYEVEKHVKSAIVFVDDKPIVEICSNGIIRKAIRPRDEPHELNLIDLDNQIRKDKYEKLKTARELGYTGFYDAISTLFLYGRTPAQIVIIFNKQYGAELLKESTVRRCLSSAGVYCPKAG